MIERNKNDIDMILTLEHYQGTLKSVLLILEAYNERFG
jgi:hypothetical protein